MYVACAVEETAIGAVNNAPEEEEDDSPEEVDDEVETGSARMTVDGGDAGFWSD